MKPRKIALEAPVMVRMDRDTLSRIRSIAQANGLSASDIIRLSVRRQLPKLTIGQTCLEPS
jgi:hypothetical protein